MIKLISIIMLIAISAFGGCKEEIFSIKDYIDFLRNMAPVEIEFKQVELDKLNGFEPLVEYEFDYAQEFNGSFTYIRQDGVDYLMNRDGNFFYSANLLPYKLVDDMYQVNSDGKYGLNGIFGNVILDCKYTKIQTNDNCIVAYNSKEVVVFNGSDKYVKKNTFGKVDLHGDYLFINNNYYGIDFKPLITNGYRIFIPPKNDIAIIIKDSLLGYSYTNDGRLICEPNLRTAENFSFGRAVTSKTGIDTKKVYNIIDLNAEILFSSTMQLYDFNGEYTVFRDNDTNLYGIIDINYSLVTPPYLKGVRYNRVYGDFIIDNYVENKFFNVKTNKYIDTVYTEITPVDNKFIVKKRDGDFALFDKSLNVIVDNCEKLFFDGEILTFLKGEKYKYYKLST